VKKDRITAVTIGAQGPRRPVPERINMMAFDTVFYCDTHHIFSSNQTLEGAAPTAIAPYGCALLRLSALILLVNPARSLFASQAIFFHRAADENDSAADWHTLKSACC
jgi:hypothetical protein